MNRPEGAHEALAGALDYAAAGYAVGPVTIRWDAERGKKVPVFHTNWEQDPLGVSTDPDQIARWAREHPGTGFHAPTGPNGIVVVEGDVAWESGRGGEPVQIKNGPASWRRAGGPRSPMTVRTQSGGEHWYFAAGDEAIPTSANAIEGVPFVDVRGQNPDDPSRSGTVFIGGTTVQGTGRHYVANRVLPASELPGLPPEWVTRLRAAGKGSRQRESAVPAGASPTLVGASAFHTAGWIAEQAESARREAETATSADFRYALFRVALKLYKAAGAGVIEQGEVSPVLMRMVARVWGAGPDERDRQWVAEARTRAARAPWRVREAEDWSADEGPEPGPAPLLDLGSVEQVPSERQDDPAEPVAGEDAATAPAGGEADEDAAGEQDDHTTWWPRDLARLLAGELEEEPGPAVLRRTDGAALLYLARVNGVIGESESGKSWVAQYAVAQVLTDGGAALYLDFEDSERGVSTRMLAQGVPAETVMERMTYIAPEEPLGELAKIDLAEVLTGEVSRDWSIIVVDGLNAAMGLMGLDLNENKDATRFFSEFLRPMARRTGAAVLYVDHVPKDPQARNKGGIGAQAKRAMTDGLTMRAEVDTPFGRGQNGKLKLTVDKDRMGHVRGIADEGKFVGMFKLDSTNAQTGEVSASISGGGTAGPKEPTVVMEKVSIFLQGSPEKWFTTNGINDGVQGKRTTISEALNALKLRGCVEREDGPRGANQYRFVKRFTRFVAEVSDAAQDSTEELTEPPDEEDR